MEAILNKDAMDDEVYYDRGSIVTVYIGSILSGRRVVYTPNIAPISESTAVGMINKVAEIYPLVQ